ncbi:MAG: glycosyltransferase family 2 protein, partial [Burkholderiales bacterium]
MGLSVILIAKDEEACIARALRSVAWADEIVVVDSGSIDRTVDIARELGARVIVAADWPGFGAQKNRALDLATGAWVLSLDADEWLSAPSADEIRRALDVDVAGIAAYRLPRRSSFCGRFMRHSGWWPDYVVRLFRRGRARFSDDIVHERLVV